MHEERKDLSRDDVLLWLNDRRGTVVGVAVKVERGDGSLTILNVSGVLRYWRDAPDAEAFTEDLREDLAGLYGIGDASLDLSDVPREAAAWHRRWQERHGRPGDEIGVELGEHVWLSIVHVDEADER